MIGQLELRAPFDGVVVEAAEDLRPQEWVARGEPLALVVDRSSLLVEALVAEEDVRRVMVGAPARVRPRNPDVAAFDAVVEAVDVSALREFPDPILASTHQGPGPARAGPDGTSLPGVAVYRVRLRPVADLPVDRAELATVRIAASAESPAARFLRTIWGTLLRESGF
jgi:putative peptide zinc metalloprotease protein